ncbi:CHC2 zinc finger domain-containing protein [Paludisphaera mucosa]|uniref:CHC2 zinc finger domain-containing protein n=1 Tax=Paludisphaera mucosa TaxID=3030827 RepID=A0ABT6FES5_9BACT|nr:CHC2 zinc finger domain-containing protein [Paludisphaera mucosa]MDG3006080.1 CHC2 zinc finger domain-containing protein [Paludisphaera mucosa]
MKAPISGSWSVQVPRSRFDWKSIRAQVDLPTLAEALLGPPVKRESGRSLWRCPFHDERSPSFGLEPRRPHWKCFGCGKGGDAADLVAEIEHLEFPASARRAAEIVGLYLPESGTYQPPKPKIQAPPPPPKPRGLGQSSGRKLVENALEALWSDSGARWLEYLRAERGLQDETIRAARLGWTPRADLVTREGKPYTASGIVIPWFDGDRLACIKLRRTDGRDPKYLEILRDAPKAFPNLARVRPGFPLVVVEGEFDALLLGQEIGTHAAVVTIGSASSALTSGLFRALLPASPWYLATDADDAGDKFAAGWPARARRIKPFGGVKDWTDLHATGFNRIRYHWFGLLPFRPSWEELESQRWGDEPASSEVPWADQNPQNQGSEPNDDVPISLEWLAEFNAGLSRNLGRCDTT